MKHFCVAALAALSLVASGALATTPEEAQLISNAAQRGSASAQVLLALIYLEGQAGYPKDEKLAAQWLERSAQAGNV